MYVESELNPFESINTQTCGNFQYKQKKLLQTKKENMQSVCGHRFVWTNWFGLEFYKMLDNKIWIIALT